MARILTIDDEPRRRARRLPGGDRSRRALGRPRRLRPRKQHRLLPLLRERAHRVLRGDRLRQRGGGIGPILHSTNCRFRLPLGYPDQLKVGARVTDLQKDRFTMEYKIASAKHGAVAGEGTGLIVAYDYGKQVKAEVPAEVAAKIQAVEKGRDAGITNRL